MHTNARTTRSLRNTTRKQWQETIQRNSGSLCFKYAETAILIFEYRMSPMQCKMMQFDAVCIHKISTTLRLRRHFFPCRYSGSTFSSLVSPFLYRRRDIQQILHHRTLSLGAYPFQSGKYFHYFVFFRHKNNYADTEEHIKKHFCNKLCGDADSYFSVERFGLINELRYATERCGTAENKRNVWHCSTQPIKKMNLITNGTADRGACSTIAMTAKWCMDHWGTI